MDEIKAKTDPDIEASPCRPRTSGGRNPGQRIRPPREAEYKVALRQRPRIDVVRWSFYEEPVQEKPPEKVAWRENIVDLVRAGSARGC